MKQSIIVRAIGLAIVLYSFWFIGKKLWFHQDWFTSAVSNPHIAVAIGICAILYGMSEFLLSVAWRRLLIWCGHEEISQYLCHKIYGKSQIAKYIPGNIFHFAGRHILGSQAGVKHVVLAGAAIYEILGLLTMSCAIGISGIAFFSLKNSYLSAYQITSVMLVALILSITATALAPFFMKASGITLPQRSLWVSVRNIWSVYLLYFMFFIIAGLLLVIVMYVFLDLNFIIIAKTIAIFSIAWVAGFIVPGAPGGIGIREAVIVYLMTPIIGEAQGLVVAIALRFVTLLGDIWFFFVTDERVLKLVTNK